MVGEFATIKCSVNTAVSSIMWRNQLQEMLFSATDQRVLDLSIPLVSDDFQGRQYTCTAVSLRTEVYTETVEIQVVGKCMCLFLIPFSNIIIIVLLNYSVPLCFLCSASQCSYGIGW